MVHTFELSRDIHKDTYEEIISLLHMNWYKSYFATNAYREQGFQYILLYKIKKEMFKNGQDSDNKNDEDWLDQRKELNRQWV